MARDIQKQMDRFYEHYPIMDGLENTDTIDSFIIKKYKQYKDKEIISEEEYNAEIEKLKSSNSAENDLSFKEIIQEMTQKSKDIQRQAEAYIVKSHDIHIDADYADWIAGTMHR